MDADRQKTTLFGGFLIYRADQSEELLYANQGLLRMFQCGSMEELRAMVHLGLFVGGVPQEHIKNIADGLAADKVAVILDPAHTARTGPWWTGAPRPITSGKSWRSTAPTTSTTLIADAEALDDLRLPSGLLVHLGLFVGGVPQEHIKNIADGLAADGHRAQLHPGKAGGAPHLLLQLPGPGRGGAAIYPAPGVLHIVQVVLAGGDLPLDALLHGRTVVGDKPPVLW